jgi:hypothetical protein
MNMTILTMFIGYTAFSSYFINHWIGTAGNYIASKLILSGWAETGFAISDMSSIMLSSGADFVLGTILTAINISILGAHNMESIDDELRGL